MSLPTALSLPPYEILIKNIPKKCLVNSDHKCMGFEGLGAFPVHLILTFIADSVFFSVGWGF